jgi:hypothetical protein
MKGSFGAGMGFNRDWIRESLEYMSRDHNPNIYDHHGPSKCETQADNDGDRVLERCRGLALIMSRNSCPSIRSPSGQLMFS